MKDIKEGWKPYQAESLLTEPPYIDKPFIFKEMEKQGIRKPRLYEMGFSHNNCGGFCVRAGQGHFINLLKQMPDRYKYHELKEREMQEYLGRDDISILSKSVFSHYEMVYQDGELKKVAKYKKTPYTLRQLRHDWENGLGMQIEMDDIGGCGCFSLPSPTKGLSEEGRNKTL